MDKMEFEELMNKYILPYPAMLFKDLLERPDPSPRRWWTSSSSSSQDSGCWTRDSSPPRPALPPPGFPARPLVPVVPIPTRNRKKIPRLVCHFCKRNNESVAMYTSHVCKDKNGIVVCPVLRNLSCDMCGNNGGDYAHTRRYCPLNPDKTASQGAPMPVILRTGFNSVGKRYKLPRV